MLVLVVVVDPADAVGSKVAVNGTWNGVGNTTGMLSALNEENDAPNVKFMAPVAWMTWLAPGWRVPVNTEFPDETSTAFTQQVPLVVTTIS